MVETGREDRGDAGEGRPFRHGRDRDQGARVLRPGSPCMPRFADRPCMSLKALEPASPLSNLSGERISPARKRASSRTLRSKFSRSEEHTSELQSLMRNSYAVFRLKNKKPKKTHNNKPQQ